MYLCYNCGAPAADEVEVCPQCGTQFSKPRIYQPTPPSFLGDLGEGCLLVAALWLTTTVLLMVLIVASFTAGRGFHVIRDGINANTGGAGRGLSLSAIAILSAVVGLSVVIMFAANRFFKRK